MTVPSKYATTFMPVKYFLSSYRALSDGRSGIRHLEEQLAKAQFLLSEWKIVWIGTCAVLRTAVYMPPWDAKSCMALSLRNELQAEYDSIKREEEDHAIFWKFLCQERNMILKEYAWQAFETWIKPDGSPARPPVILMAEQEARPLILMKGGPFEGRDSLELLKEGADWVEARLFGAIRRAGLDPEEERNLVTFEPKPTPTDTTRSLLGGE